MGAFDLKPLLLKQFDTLLLQDTSFFLIWSFVNIGAKDSIISVNLV